MVKAEALAVPRRKSIYRGSSGNGSLPLEPRVT
jgi:hypothetical protein